MLFLSSPLSLYSIPAVWSTGFYPAVMKTLLIARTTGYNNVDPRGNLSKFGEKKHVPRDIAARAARMEGAHLNGNETFPLWAVAILAGNYAGVDHYTLNVISLAYISLRILYNWVYINQTSKGMSFARTTLFVVSTALPIYLLMVAGNRVRSARI